MENFKQQKHKQLKFQSERAIKDTPNISDWINCNCCGKQQEIAYSVVKITKKYVVKFCSESCEAYYLEEIFI